MYGRSSRNTVGRRRAVPRRRHVLVRRTAASARLRTRRPIGYRLRPTIRGRRR